MLHYSNTDVTALERQRTRMKWRPEQLPQQRHSGDCGSLSSVIIQASRVEDFQDLMASSARRPDFANHDMPTSQFQSSVPTSSAPAGATSKKRKANKVGSVQKQAAAEAERRDKRVKASEEDEESKITGQNMAKSRATSAEETSKRNSKASEVQDSGYIHVRARRGQATDSHSLAERARREKISERMKYLQNLVPGCNKIAGKAGMLDEIINYVQSLQQQVEFLSMKLAVLSPRLDINVDDYFAKQMLPILETPPEPAKSSYFDQLGMGTSSVTVPEASLINSASFTQHFELSSTWGDDIQSLYNMALEQGKPPLPSPSSFVYQSSIQMERERS